MTLTKERIAEILKIHFDRRSGTPYWLEVQERLGFDVCTQIKSCQEFHRLGPMDVGAMRSRPLIDFIPRSLRHLLPEMILSETGGSTGDPCRRVFTREEFRHAFIVPWLEAVARHRFPGRGTWLFVGPGGPHIIARSAMEMARATGSLEPFSVDCDARWFKKQRPGSLGFTLYLDHVLDQAENIIATQEISVLFTTPRLLAALAERMNPSQRQRIRGIHTGGMAQDSELSARLRILFPAAVILPGYGNSLFGVTFERRPPRPGEESIFLVDDPALRLDLIPLDQDAGGSAGLATPLPPGLPGRIVVHRLDRSFLIINLLERDQARSALVDGEVGLTEVRPLANTVPPEREGVY